MNTKDSEIQMTKINIVDAVLRGDQKAVWRGLEQKGPTGERFASELVARVLYVYEFILEHYGIEKAKQFTAMMTKGEPENLLF